MFFFRIDLSAIHGLGHYHRVKSLIKYLNLKKYKIVIDKLSDDLIFLNDKNIIALYGKNLSYKNEKEDANLFLNLVRNENATVVKDSYRLGYIWEKKIYKYCKNSVSISDFYEKKSFVDFYINHSPCFLENSKNFYKKAKNNNIKNCKLLLGPEYALFNSTYNKKDKILSDFVFYNGGSGNILVYEKIIKKISLIKKKKNQITLIVGPLAKNYEIICKKFKNYKNVKVLYSPKDILHILAGTKVFISSAGVAMFEASFLRTPTLLFQMSSNQNLLDSDTEKLGHYFVLKKKDLNQTNKIVNLIDLMLQNRNQIKKMFFKSNVNKSNIKKNYQKYLKI
jgi:spore coat polysaccharide biosynthesis predicted glycosyltransferase SpsG